MTNKLNAMRLTYFSMVKCLSYWILLLVITNIVQSLSLADDYSSEGEEAIVDLKVNHEDLNLLSTVIRTPNGSFLMLLEDVKLFNLKDEYISSAALNIAGKKYVNLNKLAGAIIKYNDEMLALELEFPPEAVKLQQFNAIPVRDNKNLIGERTHGAFMNMILL